MVSVKTKAALIADVDHLVGAVLDRFDVDVGGGEDGDAERDFMAQRCPPRLRAAVRSLPTLSMHLLAVIAEAPVSVVGLASRSGQLKGTVSKHVARLVDAGLVTRTPVPGNRKEIELTPTADGKRLVDVHRQLHDEMARGTHDFLRGYGNAELQALARVLSDLLVAKKEGVRLVRG